MVVHQLGKLKVTGSIPVLGSKKEEYGQVNQLGSGVEACEEETFVGAGLVSRTDLDPNRFMPT